MIGEGFDDAIRKNKKKRREKALDCLHFLRGFNDEGIKENPCDYLGTLALLLELVNDKDPYDLISLEEIGTDQKEIRGFEEKSLLIEDKNICTPVIDIK
jgi:hypothetical protein